MPTTKLKFDPTSLTIALSVDIEAIFPTTANLALDTGASYMIISKRMALAIGLEIDPSKNMQLTSATSVETVSLVTLPRVSVLGKTVKNVEAVIKDLPPSAPVDGLLGLSFLKHFKLTLDFKKGELSLE